MFILGKRQICSMGFSDLFQIIGNEGNTISTKYLMSRMVKKAMPLAYLCLTVYSLKTARYTGAGFARVFIFISVNMSIDFPGAYINKATRRCLEANDNANATFIWKPRTCPLQLSWQCQIAVVVIQGPCLLQHSSAHSCLTITINCYWTQQDSFKNKDFIAIQKWVLVWN